MDPATDQTSNGTGNLPHPKGGRSLVYKNFLVYHYTHALPDFVISRPKKLADEFKFLNIWGLFIHLFSPYKRLDVGKKASITDRLSFDLISRFVGAAVRFFLIIFGLFMFVLFAFAYIWEIIFYLPPILSLTNYIKYKRDTFFESDFADSKKFLTKLENSKVYQSFKLFFDPDFVNLFETLPAPTTLGAKADQNLAQIFLTIAQNWPQFTKYLSQKNIMLADFGVLVEYLNDFYSNPNGQNPPPIGYELIYGYTNTLDKFSHELTNKQITSPYFNKKLVDRLESILTKPQANNALLVGEVGVGKHSSIENLATAITRRQLPTLADKRVLMLDTVAILASSKNLVDIKNSFEAILVEAKHAGNIILVIDSIDKITSSADARIDLTEIFGEILTDNSLPIIGITTLEEFHKFIRPNLNFLRLFDKVDVEQPAKEDVVRTLISKALTNFHKDKISTTYAAILEIIDKSDRLIPDRKQPEKSILVFEDCLVRIQKLGKKQIDMAIVDEILSEKTKVPVGQIKQTEIEKLKDLEGYLHKRVVGQDTAISEIAKAMRRSRTGLEKSTKPMGTFLFLGPTGVGKTETAKALADAYFGADAKMIRLDMTEYQGSDAVKRLIGDVDTKNPGILASLIRQNPYGLLLVDEFEKASPFVQNLFLQILDEGNLTDAFGKKLSFTNVIIIATSNAGAEFIREQVKKSEVQPLSEVEPQKDMSLSDKLIEYVLAKGLFNPELVNRFDAVVVYQPLTQDQIVQVAKLMLIEFANNLKQTKNITLEIDDALAKAVAQKGYNAQFGARPIRRLIQDMLEDEIAKMIIAQTVKNGDKIPASTLLQFL